ncbi:hypothetical protein L2E82_33148 [Cichorium intybus]|uniref:Uncharacterized protein n=1 Tax=Cichorium intybus TaxID=13427 RepID=A0ACB9BJD0_CICIN|nr:hypothetical protein L2E82_33148 [Cichorium intybus]
MNASGSTSTSMLSSPFSSPNVTPFSKSRSFHGVKKQAYQLQFVFMLLTESSIFTSTLYSQKAGTSTEK